MKTTVQLRIPVKNPLPKEKIESWEDIAWNNFATMARSSDQDIYLNKQYSIDFVLV